MSEVLYIVDQMERPDGTPYWIAQEKRTTGTVAAGPYLTPQEADAWIEKRKKEKHVESDFWS